MLASRGFVVIQPNFRGSTGYERAFQLANVKDLGGGDLEDTVHAAKILVATGYMDPKRIGIAGGSYGVFMTLMALGKKPDVFAAGVNQFGIINGFTMREQAGTGGLRDYQRALGRRSGRGPRRVRAPVADDLCGSDPRAAACTAGRERRARDDEWRASHWLRYRLYSLRIASSAGTTILQRWTNRCSLHVHTASAKATSSSEEMVLVGLHPPGGMSLPPANNLP